MGKRDTGSELFGRGSVEVPAECPVRYPGLAQAGITILTRGWTLHLKIIASVAVLAAVVLSGCETTNLVTKSTTPATIRQEFVRHSMMVNWEGSYVYGIGRTDLGYGDLGNRKGLTLTVDSGPSALRVFYISHHSGGGNLFTQSDVVAMDVDLKPTGNYTLHCEASEESARFTLIDLTTNQVAATSGEVPLYIRPTPGTGGSGYAPVFIPVRR
jgi:hypothetical protein